MKPLFKQACDIYLDTMHAGPNGLQQAVDHHFSDHCNIVGNVGSTFGKASCKGHIQIYLDAFPDLCVTCMNAIEADQNVVILPWKVDASHQGCFLGIPPTERPVSYHGHTSVHFTPSGKLIKWEYKLDLLEILRQLGTVPAHISQSKNILVCYLQKLGTDKTILTPKETECLAFLCQGLSSKYIAQYLNCSFKTIECHTQRIKEKLDCHHKEQLIDSIRQLGLFYAFRDLFDMLFHY